MLILLLKGPKTKRRFQSVAVAPLHLHLITFSAAGSEALTSRFDVVKNTFTLTSCALARRL